MNFGAIRDGTHPAPKNGAAAKASSRAASGTQPPLAPEPPASFLAMEPAPVGTPMWPLHSAAWFQAEQTAAPPAWTGLTIERHHRIPSPRFFCPELAAFDRAALPDSSGEAIRSRPDFPQSGLAPAGWDPRAFSPKENH